MNVPKAKIELAASTEKSRYTLQAVQYDVTNKRFAATDGHILAVIPAETNETDHDALIGLDTIKAMRQIEKTGHIQVHTNGKIAVTGNSQSAEFGHAEGTFPRIDAVKPSFEGQATLAIDAALLLRLAQALTDENTSKKAVVQLWIKDANHAIGVKVSSNPEAWGAIMPCALPK